MSFKEYINEETIKVKNGFVNVDSKLLKKIKKDKDFYENVSDAVWQAFKNVSEKPPEEMTSTEKKNMQYAASVINDSNVVGQLENIIFHLEKYVKIQKRYKL